MPFSENAASAIKWSAGTIVGALLGAVVTSIYQSARPSVNIIDIQPSIIANKQFIKDSAPVPIPADLERATLQSEWTKGMRGPTMPYGRFVDGLDENERRLNDYIEQWNQLKTNVPRLRAILERGDSATPDEKNEFFDIWERNDGFIYASLIGDFRRGNLTLQHRVHTGTPFFQDYSEPGDKGETFWTVHKKGGRYSSVFEADDERISPFAKEVAEDLAFFDTISLSLLLDSCVKPEITGEQVSTAALDAIFRAKRQLSRWTVQVAISNKGDSPIAFLPQAILTIETADLKVGGKLWGKPTEIRLEHRDANSELEPIYLEKGSAKLVRYSSTAFIKDIEPADSLVQAYDLGGFDTSIQLFTAGGQMLSRSTYQTPTTKFVSAGAASK